MTVAEGPNDPKQVETGSFYTLDRFFCLGQGLGGPFSYRFHNQTILGCFGDIGACIRR